MSRSFCIWKASALAHLGRIDDARRDAQEFLAGARSQWGDEASEEARILAWVLHGFPIKEPETRKRLTDGLRLAGLPVADGN